MAVLQGRNGAGEIGEKEDLRQLLCGLVRVLQEDGGGDLQPTRDR